jgi:hypothetical protein
MRQNQEVFRRANDEIAERARELDADDATPFLCECADEFCDGRVELERGDWESVASKPNHFVMVPGHPRSEGEVVIGALDGYDVVRKPG